MRRRLLSTKPVWPEGYDRLILDQTDSTMAEAARRASEISRPTWILAHSQTQAKGRQGRAWANPEGNFAATLLMRPEGAVAEAALRSFVAANALLETLALHVARDQLAQKWPNDVLLSGGKVAGILLESAGTAKGVDWLAIGIGVNLNAAPVGLEDANFAPVSLSDHGASVAPEEFLSQLAVHFAKEEARFTQDGFEPIRADWLAHAARIGDQITARTSREEITGIFETIDTAGNLVLRRNGTTQVISAADVYF
jgi:BirA family biotin operon repressor/biotin-[acetyl-CoA-carboxylase] ligase